MYNLIFRNVQMQSIKKTVADLVTLKCITDYMNYLLYLFNKPKFHRTSKRNQMSDRLNIGEFSVLVVSV